MVINTAHKRLLGNFSNLATNYLTIDKQMRAEGRHTYPFSSAGVFLYNDREGQYLNRGRMFIQYAWHAKLTGKVFISGGLKAGGVNYFVKGTPLSGSGSSWKIDGGVGLSLYTEKFYMGLAFDQLFNAELQPIDEITVLAPYMMANVFRKFKLSEKVSLTPNYLIRILSKTGDDLNTQSIGIMCDIKNLFHISGGIRTSYGILFAMGMNDLVVGKGSLNVDLSYLVPTEVSILNISTIEINLKYLIKKRR